MLKHPLQALLYAPDVALWSEVILGRRTATIREGRRDYRAGPVMLCCHLASACVMADITAVRHCRLGEVAEAKRRRAGYESQERMLEDLRRFYPDIGPDSPVTEIALANFRGTLIDQAMLVMAPKNRIDAPLIARFTRTD